MNITNHYSDTCLVTCENNSKSSTAEVYSFKEKQTLVVTLNREVKLSLRYNGQVYCGSMGQLSFVSSGPDIVRVSRGR